MVLLIIPELLGIGLEIYLILFVLGIPTYFFWRWLYRRKITSNVLRILATWASTILVTPVVYISIVVLIIMYINYYPSHRFNSQKWINDTEKRYELSEDLIDSKVLKWKTKAEVTELLGYNYQVVNVNQWSYYIGYRPKLHTIEADYLDITFENDVVVNVSQRSQK